jgi:hypothetical protein
MKKIFTLTLIALNSLVGAQNTGTIAGYVKDIKTQEALIGVAVFLEDTKIGAVTNENGYYKITDIPTKTYNVKAAYIGYETNVKFNVVATSGNTVFVNFQLEETSNTLKEAVVYTNPFKKSNMAPISVQSLSTEEIKSYPGGNNDIAKVVQSLPGVSGSVGFRNDVIIRGGAPNENVYYLDGIEIVNINHFATQGSAGGPVGMINVSFIDDVTLSTGGFNARYDNPLSGVLQFNQRSGNPEKHQGNFRLGASEVALTLDGPINKKTTYMVSARRSYLQLLFKLINLPFLPSYWDFQYKVNHKINDKNELSFIGLGSIDNFAFNPPNSADFDTEEAYLENLSILDGIPKSAQWTATNGVVWKHNLGKGYVNVALSQNYLDNKATKYRDNKEGVDSLLTLKYRSAEDETKLRIEVNKFKNKWRFSFGGNAQYSFYLNQTFNKQIPGVVLDYETRMHLFRFGLFGNFTVALLDEKLKLNGGLRTDGNTFTNTGLQMWKTFSPRLNGSYALRKNLNINASLGRYFKIAPYTVLGFKDNAGNFVNKNVDYIANNHYVLGLEYLRGRSTRITLEGFVKTYSNYPVAVQSGISLANFGGDFGTVGNEAVVSNGKGKAYGFEVAYQQKFNGKFYAIAAYTFYFSKFTGANSNKYIASAWDNRNLISLTGGYKFKKNWEIGVRYRFLGGAPYTPIDTVASLNSYLLRGSGVLDYSQLNSKRLKPFNQLDIRIDKKWNFKKWSLNAYLEIQNATVATQPSAPSFTLKRDVNAADGFARDANGNYVGKLLNTNSGNLIPTIGVVIGF